MLVHLTRFIELRHIELPVGTEADGHGSILILCDVADGL